MARRRALRGRAGDELRGLVRDRARASSPPTRPSIRRPPDAADDGALALYAWTWLGEAFANAALWRRPVTAGGRGGGDGRVRGPRRCWRGAGMRVAVVGAGVGGLAAAIQLAAAGHRVTVLEQAAAPGGKCARVTPRRLHLGHRAVAADDAVGVRRAVRGHGRAARGGARPAARRAGHPLRVRRRERGRAVGPTCRARSRRSRPGRRARAPTGRASSAPAPACGARRSASSPARRRGRRDGRRPAQPSPDPRDALRVRPWWTLRGARRAPTRATRACGW